MDDFPTENLHFPMDFPAMFHDTPPGRQQVEDFRKLFLGEAGPTCPTDMQWHIYDIWHVYLYDVYIYIYTHMSMHHIDRDICKFDILLYLCAFVFCI